MKAIFKLLNPDNTMSINRQLAHAIGLAEAVVYGALLSKYAYYDQHGLLTDGDWFYSTVEDLEESTALTARQQPAALILLSNPDLFSARYRVCLQSVTSVSMMTRSCLPGSFQTAVNPVVTKAHNWTER